MEGPQTGQTRTGTGMGEDSRRRILQMPGSVYHRFSWLDSEVDVSQECMLCLMYQNSPCEAQHDIFIAMGDMKQLTETQIKVMQRQRESTLGKQLQMRKLVQILWDKHRKCVELKQRHGLEVNPFDSLSPKREVWFYDRLEDIAFAKVLDCTRDNERLFEQRSNEQTRFFKELRERTMQQQQEPGQPQPKLRPQRK